MNPRVGDIFQVPLPDGRFAYGKVFRDASVGVYGTVFNSPTHPVFAGVTPDQVSVTFRRLCRKKGILDFRFHDLRHTAASWMRMEGADIHTVAQLLGHKDLRMAARYQHLSPSFLADAVRKLDAVFGTIRYQDVTARKALTATSAVSR